jgi:erythromycin esterase
MRRLSATAVSFVFAVGLTSASAAGAQQPLNLDFEELSGIDPRVPAHWTTVGTAYELVLDSAVVHSGRVSLRSRRVVEREGSFGTATHRVPAGDLRGKRLRLSGWIRTEAVTGGFAGIWMRVDGPPRPDGGSARLAFDNMADRGARGTTGWSKYTVELPVDSSAQEVVFGAIHAGAGTAWFDGLELTAVDAQARPERSGAPDIGGTGAAPEQVDWLRRHAVPLRTDAPGTPLEDLRPLRPMFEGARIIGLGEGTHGTREHFRIKHRLVEWLAGEEGVSVFAIEANMPEARLVNEYVLTGRGDPRAALAGLGFWTWDTEEVLELIEWMRAHNRSGRGRIEFWGFDMQTPGMAADSVIAFVARADPSLGPRVREAYERIVSRDIPPAEEDRSPIQAWLDAAEEVHDLLRRNRGSYLERVPEAEVDWAIQNARIVAQAAAMRIPRWPLQAVASRDSSMAANVEWIASVKRPGARIVLWAHNGHVARQPNMMGVHLAERFGEAYRAVALALGEGEYTAVGQRGLAAYPAVPPLQGSLEQALRATGSPIVALDLRRTSAEAGGTWLREPRLFRSIGARAVDWQFFSAPVAERFDVLIYFDRTTATRPNRRPSANPPRPVRAPTDPP